MMKNNQNVIIAIALSFLIIVGWQFFVIGPKMEAERQAHRRGAVADGDHDTGDAPDASADGAGMPAAHRRAGAAGAAGLHRAAGTGRRAGVVPRDAALASHDRVAIDTPSLKGSINLVGGRIDDLRLADYHETVDPTSPLVELFSPAGSEQPLFRRFRLGRRRRAGPPCRAPRRNGQAEGGPLAPGNDVTLTWDNGAGLVFKRSLFGRRRNTCSPSARSVENTTGAPVALFPFGLVSRTGLPKTSGYYILHEGLIGYLGDDGLQEIKYKKLDERPVDHAGEDRRPAGSASPTNTGRAALIPSGDKPFQPRFLKGAAGARPTYQADFLGDAVSVPAGGTARARDAALRRRQGDARSSTATRTISASRISTC